MQAGELPKVLGCPLPAEGRPKKGARMRLEEILRDTVETLVAEAGFLQYPCLSRSFGLPSKGVQLWRVPDLVRLA